MGILNSVVTKFRPCGACHEGTHYSLELMEDGTIRRGAEGCNGYAGEDRLAKAGENVSPQDAIIELSESIQGVQGEIQFHEEEIESLKDRADIAQEMLNSLERTK
jgi:hypothetical protein